MNCAFCGKEIESHLRVCSEGCAVQLHRADEFELRATRKKAMEKSKDGTLCILGDQNYENSFVITIRSMGGVSMDRIKDIIERYHEVVDIHRLTVAEART